MKATKKILSQAIIIISLLLISSQIQAQIPEQIVSSFKSGDSKKLAQYFNSNVELVVLENDNVYSKAQAQQIVAKFFSTNTPENFTIMHDGGSEGARYAIGSLKTKNGSFRVYFLLKSNEGKDYIHQLRIEKQQ
ncbi:MAG: DUF4783 domain-containing protein [Prolixibacteraceae bacterium]|nr:DUF4783 domain-containing protein [Prolixibacteraceae bacterium]